MCPIETPEGPNIGLIVSLATYTTVNEYGFLETPYRKVVDGRGHRRISSPVARWTRKVLHRPGQRQLTTSAGSSSSPPCPAGIGRLREVGPQGPPIYGRLAQADHFGVSAACMPFLEHDDANRALMGSNMQRQAVPLVFTEPPRVGTGMERKTAYDSGVLIKAKRAGVVDYVDAFKVVLIPDEVRASATSTCYQVCRDQPGYRLQSASHCLQGRRYPRARS